MGLEWSQDISTGVEWQDNQHKELLDQINKLLAAISQGKGKEEVVNTLNFLESYIDNHFRDEEHYMEKFDFPGREEHIREHRSLTNELLLWKSSYVKGGTSQELVSDTMNKMFEWLFSHFGETDQILGSFLQNQTENKGLTPTSQETY